MGIIKQGILGGFSGKIGNVVGTSWKGIAVIKAMPLSVANPKTASQQLQRGKMAWVVLFARVILSSIIKPLRDRFAVQQSGFNTFVHDNIHLFENEHPSPASDLILAQGKMAATPIATFDPNQAGSSVAVTWTDDSGSGYKLATDKAYVLLISGSSNGVGISAGEVERAAGTVTVDFSEPFAQLSTYHAYLVFLRADGTVVSNTSYKSKAIL